MKLVAAFLKLVRWPNLVFIILTQILFEYCVLQPIFIKAGVANAIHGIYFILVCGSYILIAASGYIINDYFDLNIDLVNKPKKVIVSKSIIRRWALFWHIFLSAVAVFSCIYVDRHTTSKFVGITAFSCVILLFFYSISLKKKNLWGNVVVSVLTASSIFSLTLFENSLVYHHVFGENGIHDNKIIRFTILYTSFAFIISLIREVIKDMEDVDGDSKYGCRTMPIVWGINSSKVFVAVWLVVLLAIIIILQLYVLQFGWWISVLYSLATIIFPLFVIFRKLFKAQSSKDFHQLSSLVKLVMFTGILSMIFFKIYS